MGKKLTDAEKAAKKEAKARRKAARSRLLGEAKPFLPTLLIGTCAAFVSSGANAMLPKMLGRLLDNSGSADASLKRTATLLFVSGGAASFLRTACMALVEQDLTASLKAGLFASLLRTPLGDAAPPAELTKLLDEECETAAKSLTSTSVSFVRSFSGTFNGFYNLMSISPSLTMYSGLIVPAVGVGAIVLSKIKKKYKARLTAVHLQASKMSDERLRNLPLVKLSATEAAETAAYSALLAEAKSLSMSVALSEGAYLGTMFTSTAVILGYTLSMGGEMVKKGKLTAGQLTSYASYTLLLGMGAAGLAKAAGEFGRGVDAAAAIYAKVDAKAEKKAEKEQELKSGAIELKDVRFQYGSAEKPVVSSLSLSIKSGEIVALVGKNGTGKSTLVSLISNLLPADAGDVNVGGVPLGSSTKVPPHSIGLVPQHSSLFDASVLDNVMYGTHFESARGREIECDRVLELVGASGFVKGLEGGKDFVVGESGSRLSGGQKQRLSLARGLVGGCKVVLFDEPDTYLEDNTAVAEAVKSCRDAGMTVVVVTHHLHIVRMCDRVVELGEGGKVVSDGTLKEYEKGAVGGMVV